MSDTPEPELRPWAAPPPGRLVGRGHAAGDFLEAWAWDVLEESPGRLRVEAALPDHVKNPRGQLFGGFTPTYVDLVALLTLRSAAPRDGRRGWLATLNMRVDYFEPITRDFEVESRLVNRRGANAWVETRFLDPDSRTLLAFALTTLRETGIG